MNKKTANELKRMLKKLVGDFEEQKKILLYSDFEYPPHTAERAIKSHLVLLANGLGVESIGIKYINSLAEHGLRIIAFDSKIEDGNVGCTFLLDHIAHAVDRLKVLIDQDTIKQETT